MMQSPNNYLTNFDVDNFLIDSDEPYGEFENQSIYVHEKLFAPTGVNQTKHSDFDNDNEELEEIIPSNPHSENNIVNPVNMDIENYDIVDVRTGNGQEGQTDKSSSLENHDKNLALRNIKLNFGTGLIQFCEFKAKIYLKNGKKSRVIKLADLGAWLKIMQSQGYFRSFDGWRAIWNDMIFGKLARKLSKKFFGTGFVNTYIGYSRIKPEYRMLYRSKAKKFYVGACNPESFIPQRF